MRPVAIGIAIGRDSLVDLQKMHGAPGHVHAGKMTEHDPGRSTAADGHHKAAFALHDRAGFDDDQLRRFASNGFVIGEDVCFQDSSFPFVVPPSGGELLLSRKRQETTNYNPAALRCDTIMQLVELSCDSFGGAWLSNSGMIRWASTLPNSTPH